MQDILKRFEEVPTTCISDAMQGLNNLNPSIKPLKDEYKLVGRAFTVKIPVGDNQAVLRAIRDAKPGEVLVIDAKGDTYRAVAGDFVVGMAQTLGIKGMVVDGVIRDIQGIRDLNYPVFCKGTTVAASGKAGMGEISVPISCGGVSIEPGDIIVGDADGVVAVPQEKAEAILAKALEKMKKDDERASLISGKPEAIRQHLNDLLSK